MAQLDEELAFEAGLLAFALMLAGALLALLLGRASSRAEDARGRAAEAPAEGELPPGRHDNIRSVSPR